MGLFKEDIYRKIEVRKDEKTKIGEMSRVLEKINQENAVLDYLGRVNRIITIYNGNTNEESVLLTHEGLRREDLEAGGGSKINSHNLERYAKLLYERGLTPQGVIEKIESSLEQMLGE